MDIRELSQKEIPKSLFEIPQPPKKLFIKGSLPKEDSVYLCVVGSRKFSNYGKDACEKLIEGLRGKPVVIVSGLALGIDSIAHKSALRAGLETVVFPGSGLSDSALYPRSNFSLAREIIDSGGCMISEFEPDFRATPWGFIRRNRLMAGISKAILIIEAEEKSGTLVTARLGTDYNKDVLAVPGSIFSPSSLGTNKLIRQGATPITSPDDLLEALGFEREDAKKPQTLFDGLNKEEERVISLLRDGLERDELIRELGMSIQEANELISVMEIKGLLKENLGEIRINF